MLTVGHIARVALVLFPLSFASAANILLNPSFEAGSGGPFSGSSAGSQSSPATGWGIWNNTAANTTTELLPTTLPTGTAGLQMLHIDTAGTGNGAYQVFANGTYNVGLWVYVLSGNVGLGLVSNGGSTVTYVEESNNVLNQWLFLNTASAASTFEIVIYSLGGGANFYTDLASVDTSPISPDPLLGAGVPEPSTFGLAGLVGMAIVTIARSRCRKL